MKSNRAQSRGFSLLEVLVAVVILSVGLLSLAAMQLSLIRSSAETKAQSQGMALAKEKLETLDTYQAMGGADSTCISPSTGTVNTCYRAITDETLATVATIGSVAYQRQTVVTRYVYDESTSNYIQRGDTALDSAILAASATALPGKEFKRIVTTVQWTDATGVARTVGLEGAISAVEPSDTMAVSDVAAAGTPRKAISVISNPDSSPGAIPIAIGNGTDTAATNPRPVVVSQGNNMTTVETRFDIYTYAALNASTATAQSRVETAVVGCKCTYGTGTHTAYRPTYWNGFIYKEPEQVSGIPVSVEASGVTQSDLCTSCCRDHHDPALVAAPKFDPRRTTHNHYLDSNLSSIVSGNGNSYNEACRLIRVNGIFRVAAEPYNDHYGLLATVGLANSTATSTITNAVPAEGVGSMTENYQTYVLNYLKARFVNSTAYNTPLTASSVTGYSALQTPVTAGIDSTSSPQFMHSRGLYIDYLHTDAIAAIASAKADCLAISCTATELQTAVLKLIPFTSVNTTELAAWVSSLDTKVSVSQLQDFSESLDVGLPVSGRATHNSGNSGDSVTATTTIQGSSAGLAITEKVFPDAEFSNNAMADTQPFTIGGAVGGGFPGGETFTVQVPTVAADNVTAANADFLATVLSSNPMQVTFVSPVKSCTANSLVLMSPWTCTTNTSFGLGVSTPVKLYNYNRSAFKVVQNSCTRPNPASNADDSLSPGMPYLVVFDVLNTSTIDGAALTVASPVNPDLPGSTGESTNVTGVPNVGSVLKIYFSNKAYKCPSNWSTFLNSSGDDTGKTPDNSNGSTECVGSGSNKTPNWSTTYADCWVGFTP